ncbi:MAG: hypothetical protein HKN87_10820 [Saprospiraceae bacterium]|nr:hypothetical protein [Saprospiraceae bacterium]
MHSVKILLLAGLTIFFLVRCSTEPQPIVYGEDQCHSCKMIIADPRFGSELVTSKGKIYKFDAIECLVPTLLEWEETAFAHLLVSDYKQPGTLIDASKAQYLISELVPSPMGRYLSAYHSIEDIRSQILTKDDRRLSWNDLLREFAK